MIKLVSRTAGLLVASGALAVAFGSPLSAEGRVAKDTGPASAACDAHAKGTAAWTACVGTASRKMADEELFYAGYWLAKSGQYAEALRYLDLTQTKDERVLTYIGFATRKLGDVDAALPLYRKALAVNPDYVVARAYLGEAFLIKGQPDQARGQLEEIAERCGTRCAAYVDLAGQIADYEEKASRG
ncbi:tetratricopeptide repeat protein [Hyphomicrobium sp.]|uniref:tetratricopeptide repeat protein n=1 Tax=Hyphomicrobium sp. TaxID=82 RepID=UPI0025C5E9B1|nr:tetratricopeptide repeat protein [Hyphomicrobium sp.]MCC7253323.1 tetratricopeptide repeat protein [Hyphomicrobium sp.]